MNRSINEKSFFSWVLPGQYCLFHSKVASLKMNVKMSQTPEEYIFAATFVLSFFFFYQSSYPLFIFQHSIPQHFLLLRRSSKQATFSLKPGL